MNIFRTVSGTGIYLASVVLANVLIARMLGVEGRGQVAAAVLIPTTVAYAGELGLPVATGYLVSTQSHNRRRIIAVART
ncbi:MAG: hypothetical protein ACRDJ9_17485, partial [Dehalococcoidia bacterium]